MGEEFSGDDEDTQSNFDGAAATTIQEAIKREQRESQQPPIHLMTKRPIATVASVPTTSNLSTVVTMKAAPQTRLREQTSLSSVADSAFLTAKRRVPAPLRNVASTPVIDPAIMGKYVYLE